jgi:uncharacterized protein (TIGR02246 family)
MAQESVSTHIFDNWPKLVEAGEVKGLIALFTDDVVWMSPGEIISGKEALRLRTVGTFAEAKATGSAIKVDHEQIAGSWANVTASFTATWIESTGKKFTERSRYVCVLRRASDGQWKIWSFIFFPTAQ